MAPGKYAASGLELLAGRYISTASVPSRATQPVLATKQHRPQQSKIQKTDNIGVAATKSTSNENFDAQTKSEYFQYLTKKAKRPKRHQMFQKPPDVTVVVEQAKRFTKRKNDISSPFLHRVNQELGSTQNVQSLVIEARLSNKLLPNTIAMIDTPYVMFVCEGHDWSTNLIRDMKSAAQERTPALIEPYAFTAAIPTNPKWEAKQNHYSYTKDTSFYGKLFQTKNLLELYKNDPKLDRRALYLSYRLHWGLESTSHVDASYTTSNTMLGSRGLKIKSLERPPLPLTETDSVELRTSILKFVILVLRRLRHRSNYTASLQALQALVQCYDLNSLTDQSLRHYPIESMWIAWLNQPSENQHLTKALTNYDTYTHFSNTRLEIENQSVLLNTIETADCTINIYREYRPREQRNRSPHAGVYNFYSRPILTDSIILLFDRPSAADDNAEHLYRYIANNMPEYSNTYFALSDSSPDWERLRAEGFKLTKFYSPEFYDIYLRSDAVISSQLHNLTHRGKNARNSRFIYLQHGIQLNDMTTWITSNHFDLIVSTGPQEYEYLSSVAPAEVVNTGMPRLQYLERKLTASRSITYMPTWAFRNHALPDDAFSRTEFVKRINQLLQDDSLRRYLSRTHTILKVKLHPNLTGRINVFKTHGNSILTTESYKDLIESSSLVFTDYSSAVLDAAFVDVPIAFYQPDARSFFKTQIYSQRISYRSVGLGPVFSEMNSLVDYIVNERYTTDRDQYSRKKETFFGNIEKSTICRSIMERVLAL